MDNHNQQVGQHTVARDQPPATHKTTLARRRRQTSPIPMGLTPRSLSKAIRRQVEKADRLTGSTKDAANPLATTESHKENQKPPGRQYTTSSNKQHQV